MREGLSVTTDKHTGDDVTTVTASCDRITIHSPLTEICDLQLSGRVTYATGRSSLEITMQVAKAPQEGEKVRDEDVLINCTFTMVSLDPGTKKYIINGNRTCSLLMKRAGQ
jgi:acyl-coenzyme A thioesterase 9